MATTLTTKESFAKPTRRNGRVSHRGKLQVKARWPSRQAGQLWKNECPRSYLRQFHRAKAVVRGILTTLAWCDCAWSNTQGLPSFLKTESIIQSFVRCIEKDDWNTLRKHLLCGQALRPWDQDPPNVLKLLHLFVFLTFYTSLMLLSRCAKITLHLCVHEKILALCWC